MNIELAEALPILTSSATMVALLGFDKALDNQATRHFKASTTPNTQPHMIRNFTVWWMDLTGLVAAGLSSTATAVLVERTNERIALITIATTYWFSAVLAAVAFEPFEYERKFRLIIWCVKAANRSRLLSSKDKQIPVWNARTSPAFTLVIAGNLIGLSYTITL